MTLVERAALFAVTALVLFSLVGVVWGDNVRACDADNATTSCHDDQDPPLWRVDRDPLPDEDGWNEPPPPEPDTPNPCAGAGSCGRD